MSTTTGGGEFGNPLRKFKLVFLGEQSGKQEMVYLNPVLIWTDMRNMLEEVAKMNLAYELASLASCCWLAG